MIYSSAIIIKNIKLYCFHMEKLIYCNDSCLVAMIARTNKSNRWNIFGISKVHGLGSMGYDRKLFDFDFIEVVPLDSSNGKAYVCLNKDNKWGLMEVRDNNTAISDWSMLVDFLYEDMNSLMEAF